MFTSLLGLDFSAMIFPVVYIGAIAILFLLIVMMFHIQIAEIHGEVLHYLQVSGIIGLIVWWEMSCLLSPGMHSWARHHLRVVISTLHPILIFVAT